MALPEEQQKEMDTAATAAEKEFKLLDQGAREAFKAWWENWYGDAGHKRLGRVVLGIYAPKES